MFFLFSVTIDLPEVDLMTTALSVLGAYLGATWFTIGPAVARSYYKKFVETCIKHGSYDYNGNHLPYAFSERWAYRRAVAIYLLAPVSVPVVGLVAAGRAIGRKVGGYLERVIGRRV